MKITVTPMSAHYQGRTLVFNLSNRSFALTDSIVSNIYDIAFVFGDDIVYVKIGAYLKFGSKSVKTGNEYGPYSSAKEMVLNTLFGKYDNLIYFLENYFVFESNINEYVFDFYGFKYSLHTYNFTANIIDTLKSISDMVYPINIKFDIEKETHVHYDAGAVENFINTLRLLFNRDNFKSEFIDSGNYLIARSERSSAIGIEFKNSHFFFFNMSPKRHATVVVPYEYPDGYAIFESSGTQDGDNFLQYVEANRSTVVITNKTEVERLSHKYGFDKSVKSVTLNKMGIFENIVAILAPSHSVRILYIILKDDSGAMFAIKADMFSMKFIVSGIDEAIQEILSVQDTYNIANIDGSLVVSSGDASDYNGSADMYFSKDFLEFEMNNATGVCKTSDGNKMSASFVTDYLQHYL